MVEILFGHITFTFAYIKNTAYSSNYIRNLINNILVMYSRRFHYIDKHFKKIWCILLYTKVNKT